MRESAVEIAERDCLGLRSGKVAFMRSLHSNGPVQVGPSLDPFDNSSLARSVDNYQDGISWQSRSNHCTEFSRESFERGGLGVAYLLIYLEQFPEEYRLKEIASITRMADT